MRAGRTRERLNQTGGITFAYSAWVVAVKWTIDRHEEVPMGRQGERRTAVQHPITFDGAQGFPLRTIFPLPRIGSAVVSRRPVHPVHFSDVNILPVYISARQRPVEAGEAEVTWGAGKDFGVQSRRLRRAEQERSQAHVAELRQGRESRMSVEA